VSIAAPKAVRLFSQVAHMVADMQVDVTLRALQKYESEGGLTKDQAIALITNSTSLLGSSLSSVRSSVKKK